MKRVTPENRTKTMDNVNSAYVDLEAAQTRLDRAKSELGGGHHRAQQGKRQVR